MTSVSTEAVLADIKSRGYWEVTIRPTSFDKERIANVVELEPLLESMQVRISGWYFPHLRSERATIKGDCIEESAEFDTILETFRFCQSGQFIYLAAFREDWPERAGMFDSRLRGAKPNEMLGITSVIYRFTHIYDLAARMAQKVPGSDDLLVDVVAHHIANRSLVVDSPNRLPLYEDYRAAIADFQDTRRLPRGSLMAEPRKLAVEAIERLFVQFQWRSVTKLAIAGWQEQLFGVQK